jgi:signal transduction histidine kinase
MYDRGANPKKHAKREPGARVRHAAQLHALAEASLAINATLALEAAIQLITERARAIVGAHQAITSLAADGDWAQATSAASFSDKYPGWPPRVTKPGTTGIHALVCLIEHPLRLTQAELEAHPAWPGLAAAADTPPLRGLLAAPLVNRDGQNIGLILLSDRYSGDFSAEDEVVLVQLAQMASVALDNARLYESERQARAEAEAARQRLAFLAEASEILSMSLEYETRVMRLTQLAVPYLADWCIADMIQDDGSVRRLKIALADASKEPLAEQLQQRYPVLGRDVQHTILSVLKSAQSWMDSEVSETRLAAEARDAEHLAILRGLGFRSEMVVPLVARERILGTLTFVRGAGSPGYGPADLALAEELAHRAALSVENARLYQAAQTSLRARDELLSVVSHDLQNPLTAIKGQAQLLRRRAAQTGTPEMARMADGLARIDAETTKMTRLIGELLDLARMQVGQSLELNRHPVDVVALARQVAADTRATTQDQIRIVTTLDELIVPADAIRVERLLANLLSNAVKYSPGGGRIDVEIGRAAEAGADWAILVVRDRGLGIPAAELPFIFERFHRASNVATQIGGHGIGLWSARQIVEQHGGTITAVSTEGQGSAFTIRLPLATPPPA